MDAATLHRESVVIDGLNASHFLEPKILDRLEAGAGRRRSDSDYSLAPATF